MLIEFKFYQIGLQWFKKNQNQNHSYTSQLNRIELKANKHIINKYKLN